MHDTELLERFGGGDTNAFETVMARYEAGLIRYATSLTHDRHLAGDVVQETFVALVDSVRRGCLPDQPGSWLFRVARNRAHDAVKTEVRMKSRHRAVAVPEAFPPTTDRVEEDECAQVVNQHFARLDEDRREVLVLKVQEGKTYREISSITGFSLAKISDLVHRGLKQLSRELRAAGVV